ncbi:MAG: hypothetical protein M1822_006410 [Bathelium mastoideum]|nr:MAG: hypothetical protein M1822_006410 [Bathelium mastoideum]
MRLPIAFSPIPVTIIVVLVHAALIVSLLYTHLVLPPGSTRASTYPAVDLPGAWRDLQELSNGFHHFNTKRNDVIHNWLLSRIESILKNNKVDFETNASHLSSPAFPAPVVLFDDRTSNVSISVRTYSTYFESTNIIVYIRGTDDGAEDWWKLNRAYEGQGGVLVNAHYDSVSTGFGATDDGAGVVTVLQLIAHFTSEGNRPKRGIVALLNNGEEDFLNGANAFAKHPISQFPRTFLNLEGAGSGGRATLFRSTDTEVTKAYKNSPYPFGTVSSDDGFKRGLIRSGTDYQVFTSVLGLRGLDVAFMDPRSNYHTDRDNTKHSSKGSLWHMMSAALATMESLTSDDNLALDKTEPGEGSAGSKAVWFDLYGLTFAVFELNALFAISVTLLVVGPLILIVLQITLSRAGKWYPFSRKQPLDFEDVDNTVPGLPLDGFRGFFRPITTMIISTAVVVALAFLLAKVNSDVIYSHQDAVWTMMLTAFATTSWFCLRGADFTRPTALQRFYTLFWLYIISYILLVGATILERNFEIAGIYFVVLYSAAMLFALLISYCELFALPRKSLYAQLLAEHERPGFRRADSTASSRAIAPRSQHHSRSRESSDTNNEDEDATEEASLLRNDRGTTSFAGYGGVRNSRRQSGQASSTLVPPATQNGDEAYDSTLGIPYLNEQPWSARLPSILWILQFLLVCPIPVILTGQLSLLLTSALHQTSADGSAVLPIYLFISGLTFFLLSPVLPFIHRFHYHIPSLFLLIFILSLIYNLLAFPFTETSRLKTYFLQHVDLDTGENTVTLTGLYPYISTIASSIPSATDYQQNQHRPLNCTSLDLPRYSGLTTCRWTGLPPRAVPNALLGLPPAAPPELGYAHWLRVNASRPAPHHHAPRSTARFELAGRNTRACRLEFARAITNYSVEGADPMPDGRFEVVDKDGCTELRLWSREWERGWNVTVSWENGGGGDGGEEEGQGLDGRVVCLWSDANEAGAIPALEEVWRFMPAWSTAVKGDDGLVLGWKRFAV